MTTSRVTPKGWAQNSEPAATSRVTPTGWRQTAASGSLPATFKTYLARNRTAILGAGLR